MDENYNNQYNNNQNPQPQDNNNQYSQPQQPDYASQYNQYNQQPDYNNQNNGNNQQQNYANQNNGYAQPQDYTNQYNVQPQQYNQPYYDQQYPQYYEQPQDNSRGFAIASLILGIVSFFCCGSVCSILGLIFGIISRKRKPQNNGMATAGIVLSIIALVLWAVYMIAVVAGIIELDTYSYYY